MSDIYEGCDGDYIEDELDMTQVKKMNAKAKQTREELDR